MIGARTVCGQNARMDAEPGPDASGHEIGAQRRTGAADRYDQLDVCGLRGIVREELAPRRSGRAARPSWVEVEILAALWSYGFLFANQIWRRWWPGRTERWAYQALRRMAQAGWIDRYKLLLADGGTQQRFYGLAEAGFELARGRRLRNRPGVPRDASWRRLVLSDTVTELPVQLRVNGWLLALEELLGGVMVGWRGPEDSRLVPPRHRVRGQWIELRPADIVLGTSHRLIGYQASVLAPVSPHATVELSLDDRTRVDLMIEYHHGDDVFDSEQRLARYDLFLSGWAHLLNRYQPPRRPPIVVFVCHDQTSLANLIQTADRALTTRIAKAGTSELEWPFVGRRSILFALERDVHAGSLRALAVPTEDPQLHERLRHDHVAPTQPRTIQIIDPQLLPARATGTDGRRGPRHASRAARRNG